MKHVMNLLLAASLCAVAACNKGDGPPAQDLGPPDLARGRPMLGAPIDAPKNMWTWVDFPDTSCNEGTPTGLGINKSDSKNLLIVLSRGGACWDYLTCFTLKAATLGPYRKQEFDAMVANIGGSVLDRNTESPFKDWNLVFVPYCTGDVHAGVNTTSYTGGGMTHTFRHVGRNNLTAFLARLAATFPEPERLVVAGMSSGGVGAYVNYDLFRTYFQSGKVYLLNDSGIVLADEDIERRLRQAWYMSWRLDKAIGDICPRCVGDLSAMNKVLAEFYPNDRFGYLAFTQDPDLQKFYQVSQADIERGLLRVARDVLDPMPQSHYFYIRTNDHVMLDRVGMFSSQGVQLVDWLRQMVSDDPAWKSVKP